VQLVRLTRLLAASTVPTVIAGDLNMPGPVTGLAVGYAPAVNGWSALSVAIGVC